MKKPSVLATLLFTGACSLVPSLPEVTVLSNHVIEPGYIHARYTVQCPGSDELVPVDYYGPVFNAKSPEFLRDQYQKTCRRDNDGDNDSSGDSE